MVIPFVFFNSDSKDQRRKKIKNFIVLQFYFSIRTLNQNILYLYLYLIKILTNRCMYSLYL